MLNSNPVTPALVSSVGCALATANTDKTGATASNIVTLYTPTTAANGGLGCLVQDIVVTAPSATATTTVAAVVCIFKNIGGTRYLIREVALAVGGGSTTAAGATSGKVVLNEFLAPGTLLDVLTTVTMPIHCVANIGEYGK